MKIDKCFTESEKEVIRLVTGPSSEKYNSRLLKDGGLIFKTKKSKLPFLKDKIEPIFISKEFVDQVLSRRHLYGIYSKLQAYKEKTSDVTQLKLCDMYMQLIDKVQNTCSSLKDDDKINEFLQFLSNKCSHFTLDFDIEEAGFINCLLLQTTMVISKIELPSKEDMSYMKKYNNYMSNLLSQKQDDMSL